MDELLRSIARATSGEFSDDYAKEDLLRLLSAAADMTGANEVDGASNSDTPGMVRFTDGLGLVPERLDLMPDQMRALLSQIAGELKAARAEIARLRAYANAAHWWAEAHNDELTAAADTRAEARSRMIDAEAALLLADHVFAGLTLGHRPAAEPCEAGTRQMRCVA